MRIQIDDMFDDYVSHLVSEETQDTIDESDWSYVEGYIRWFFRVSHSHMVQAPPGDTSRPAHQGILEDEQTQLDHAEDLLPKCRRIVEIAQAGIDKDIFSDGSDVRQVLNIIMMEARGH